MRRALMIAVVLMASGCAMQSGGLGPAVAYVDAGVTPADTAALASQVAAFAITEHPSQPVSVAVPSPDRIGLGAAIVADMQQTGLSVSPAGPVRLAYDITVHAPDTLLVRMSLGGIRATRLFLRGGDGILVPDGLLTVMEASGG